MHRLPVVIKTSALIALGVWVSHGVVTSTHALVTMFLGAVLWVVLYGLNEWSDLRLESGASLPVSYALLLSGAAVFTMVAASYISGKIGILFGLMIVSQVLYCIPPFRVKRYWYSALVLSGIVNPVLRLESGAALGIHSVPMQLLMAFILLHLGAAARSRCLLRKRDSGLGYVVAPVHLERFGIAVTALGIVGSFIVCYRQIVPQFLALFVALAAGFAVYSWSSKDRNIGQLRRAWLWFAVLAIIFVAIMALKP
jgi:hypothetical protein